MTEFTNILMLAAEEYPVLEPGIHLNLLFRRTS